MLINKKKGGGGSKTLPTVENFENGVLSFQCGRQKESFSKTLTFTANFKYLVIVFSIVGAIEACAQGSTKGLKKAWEYKRIF